jgi:putative peptidoglycan lipid II flippase
MGALRSIFIPNYVKERKTTNEIHSFQSTVFLITAFITIFFVIIAVLFTDTYVKTFFAGHTERYYELINIQFYYLAPCIVLWGFTSVLNGLLTIYDDFKSSSISDAFIPLGILTCLFFFKDELGETVLAIGTLAGSIVSFLFALFIVLNKNIIKIGKPNFKSVNIIEMLKQFPSKITAGLLIGVNPIVDQYFSAQLVIGSIAALNYGIKVPAIIITVFTIALGNVLLPYFSNFAAEDKKLAYDKLIQTLKYVVVTSIIIVIVLVLISTPVIRILFERDSFKASDTVIVSRIQQMYLLQIPFYICSIVMVRYLTAINKNNFMVFTSLLSLILNIVFNYILIETLGVYGLALATSIVYLFNCLTLYVYIRQMNRITVIKDDQSSI